MKQFSVKMVIGANQTETMVKANNGSRAMEIVKKMFPMARVINYREI